MTPFERFKQRVSELGTVDPDVKQFLEDYEQSANQADELFRLQQEAARKQRATERALEKFRSSDDWTD